MKNQGSKSLNRIAGVSLGILILLWIMVTKEELVTPLFLPSPGSFISAIIQLFTQNNFGIDIFASVSRVFIAFFISLLLALPLALFMSEKKWVNDLLGPYIDFIRYLPVPVLIPLTILFFGIGEEAKLFLLFVGTFFQLILLILDDLKNIPKEYSETAYTLGFTEWQNRKMKMNAILPQLYDNCRITLGWCWTYLVIAELVASDTGIGHMIKEAQRFSNTPNVYTGILTMGLIGFLTDYTFKVFYPVFFAYKISNNLESSVK
ncbi:MAG: ABC transporter permease [Pyrinomonadaceae bacterium]